MSSFIESSGPLLCLAFVAAHRNKELPEWAAIPGNKGRVIGQEELDTKTTE
jgi:hypothetical protein